MRLLVVVLAALALIKVWASNHMYRQATEEVIVAAYRERAIAACQKDAATPVLESKQAAEGRPLSENKVTAEARRQALDTKGRLTLAAWTQPSSIRLVIGKATGPGVTMWDIDSARHKQAYLMLRQSGPDGSGETCEYDISANRAALVRS